MVTISRLCTRSNSAFLTEPRIVGIQEYVITQNSKFQCFYCLRLREEHPLCKCQECLAVVPSLETPIKCLSSQCKRKCVWSTSQAPLTHTLSSPFHSPISRLGRRGTHNRTLPSTTPSTQSRKPLVLRLLSIPPHSSSRPAYSPSSQHSHVPYPSCSSLLVLVLFCVLRASSSVSCFQ